ncbi:MAG TPA: PEP-CTERM sorting domain-containing protein [Acidobacteriaceae bacterium]|nr:PEP-CTERM sorting domain-containing protein [Acidobacteriaceae bacterium]
MRFAFALLLLASVSAFGDTLYTISDGSTGDLVIQFHAPSSTPGEFTNMWISDYGAWAPYSTDLTQDTATTVSYFEMDGWNPAGSVITSGWLGMVEPWPAACLTDPPTIYGCGSDGDTYDLDFEFFAAGFNGSPGNGEYLGVMGREGLNSLVTLSVVDPPSSVPEPATAGLILAALIGLFGLMRLKRMLA